MKRLLLITLLLSIRSASFADDKEIKQALKSSKPVVWAGLDYSMVRMISNGGFEHGFNVPDLIFPGMLEKWNELFLDERIELVANTLGTDMSVDIVGVTERNKTASANQIIRTPGPKDVIDETHITSKDVTSEVQSYKMEKTNGVAIVFIVDRLVHEYQPPPSDAHNTASIGKTCNYGATYVVFFDIASRKVLSSERKVCPVSAGGNFRNFWFGPIKEADASLGKYRVLISSAK